MQLREDSQFFTKLFWSTRKKWEEKAKLLFCITFNAWDVRSHKPFLKTYLMQTDGWNTNKSHQISFFLNQMANTKPDPGREWKSQMYCFGSVGIRSWWLYLQKQATEVPQNFEQLEPYLSLPSSQRRKFCPHTCPPTKGGTRHPAYETPTRKKSL